MKIKKRFPSKIILSLAFSAFSLQAASSGYYVEIGGGAGLHDTQETKTATYVYEQKYLATFAIGYQLDLFKFELEERYKSDGLHSGSFENTYSVKVNGKLTANSQMFNTYYSGYNSSNFITTIGIGIGVSNLSLASTIEDSFILSTQAMLSVGYPIIDELIGTVNYSYFYTLKSDNFKANGDSTITFSLRYMF